MFPFALTAIGVPVQLPLPAATCGSHAPQGVPAAATCPARRTAAAAAAAGAVGLRRCRRAVPRAPGQQTVHLRPSGQPAALIFGHQHHVVDQHQHHPPLGGVQRRGWRPRDAHRPRQSQSRAQGLVRQKVAGAADDAQRLQQHQHLELCQQQQERLELNPLVRRPPLLQRVSVRG